MSVIMTERRIKSTDGIHELYTRVYTPDSEIRAIFHVVHGMTEHIGRYDGFLRAMAQKGFLAFAFDNAGHGKTAKDDSELGFIAHKDGYKIMAEDVYHAAMIIKKEFGEKLPYYLMGHSMGSFIVRFAVQLHPTLPDKVVIMGTGGPNAATNAGLMMVNLIKAFKGEKAKSPFIQNLAFGAYNKGFEGKGDWLSKDPEVRRKYDADKFCNFSFSLSAYKDLLTLNKIVNIESWFSDVPKNLPILMVSGAEDPVGDHGKGVKIVFDKLKKHGANVQLKLYRDCRHEILNDTSRDEVIEDISKFLG